MSYRRTKRDRVLVVDDDASLAEMLTIVLEGEGLTAGVCRSGDRVMAAFTQFKPDVVLLDLMLPGLDGMSVCRQIREKSTVPIIMLTAKADTPDVVAGLEAGADDYITKPFKNTELVARVRARLRRSDQLVEPLVFGEIALDPAGHTVTRKGVPLELTPLEFDLLACLLSDPAQVFTREVLLQKVWGYHHPGDTKLVNVHMTRLRSKIEDDAESPEIIRTVRGVGYQAITPVLMRGIAGIWRRSIQARVVTSTILLSALVISLTGWALLRDVASGLAESRRVAAISEARSGFEAAQARLDAAVETEPGTQSQSLTQMVDTLTSSRGSRRTYELVLQGPLAAVDGQVPVRSSAAIMPDALPDDLADTVKRKDGTYWRYSKLGLLGGTDREASVVVGSQLRAPGTGDSYALFYLFSMADQQSTLDLVRRALLLGGLAMVLMVGGVAWLVSRQVLDPIRMARRIAERYAGGNLEQRMHVSGEDDIARLSTSFNQMAASLQSQIRRLENLSRLQQRFVSDVSHELRTPLTTVQMASEVLYDSRERFDPQTARSAELLKGELDRFESLLSDLLDLSRFDAGAAKLALDTIDLSEVARGASKDGLLARKGVKVQVIGVDEPAVVEADIRRIARIVRNLLTNAAKYSGSDRIEIEIAQNDECVSLAVRDFGVGLSGDESIRVFDRFWRADPARTQGGTGLGLAISREDASLHGGTLVAWGAPGLGSEFILTIPKPGGSAATPAIGSVYA